MCLFLYVSDPSSSSPMSSLYWLSQTLSWCKYTIVPQNGRALLTTDWRHTKYPRLLYDKLSPLPPPKKKLHEKNIRDGKTAHVVFFSADPCAYISFQDDVTIILSLAISFIFPRLYQWYVNSKQRRFNFSHLILLLQIRKFLKYASPQISNSQPFLTNPQIFYKYCTTLLFSKQS